MAKDEKVNIAVTQTLKGWSCKGLEVREELLSKRGGCLMRANICYLYISL
jgi:hypothetical protein